MAKVVIFGGTGFIGTSLANYLKKQGLEPVLIARNTPAQGSEFPFIQWDAVSQGSWSNVLEGAHAIVNLAGKSVDCRKTPDNCDLILRSRVDSTRAIGKALTSIKQPPKVWIQMSTAHIYGDPPQQWCIEDSSPGYGLAPFVGKAWEESLLESLPPGMREVRLRTSFVMGKHGGALHTLFRIAKCGLGGTIGSGLQGMSWIHEHDLNALIHNAIDDSSYSGIYIASAPNPVSNKVFMKGLRQKLLIPFGLPAPAFLIRTAAKWLLNTDPELALYGRYVSSYRLEEKPFKFQFPSLQAALDDLLD